MQRRAYIGLGANQSDLQETLKSAIESIKSIERSSFVAASQFYKTAPVDADGPDFLNAVAAIDTELDPYGLLLHLLDIELMLGRKRRGVPGEKKAARRVDLDLLLLGNFIILSTPLTLPHPRLHQRAFVLRPLLDIAPDLRLPGMGPAAAFLSNVADQQIERVDVSRLPPPNQNA